MDMSFGLQVLALKYLLERHGKMENRVLAVPPELDREVAWLKIKGLGINIDLLTEEQKKYLESWELEI